ncbi:MAG: LysE family transporter [Nitrososphaeria archaeon]
MVAGLGWENQIINALSLFSLGFIVGLSGAIIPGPLLAFTVFDTTKKERVTGHTIIIGHALWELGIIVFILFGFGGIISQNGLIIYARGGLTLVLMGISMVRSKRKEITLETAKVNSSLIGGVFYTAFNPTQPPWWATAGLALLLKGLDDMGAVGILIVTIGHWLSDFTYYTFISLMVHRHRIYISPHQRKISIFLGIFMVSLGLYFIMLSLHSTAI